jgi:hypothetical protein
MRIFTVMFLAKKTVGKEFVNMQMSNEQKESGRLPRQFYLFSLFTYYRATGCKLKGLCLNHANCIANGWKIA